MIVEKYKIDSTIINFDDRDVVSKDENDEIIEMLFGLMLKKISEYS